MMFKSDSIEQELVVAEEEDKKSLMERAKGPGQETLRILAHYLDIRIMQSKLAMFPVTDSEIVGEVHGLTKLRNDLENWLKGQ